MYDVVCVGGGPAGLSLLASLRSSPITSSLRTALIEAQPLTSPRTLPNASTFSNRCSSITPASAQHLRTIGAWNHLKHDRVQAYQEMQVWDGVTGARIEFEMPTMSEDTIAYMVENVNLTSALLARLDELGGVVVHDRARVEDISLGENHSPGGPDFSTWPVVKLSTGQTLHARLLIGADGANSPVRNFARIPSRGWDYGRHGVVATLEHADENYGRKIAYQRFLPSGTVALLPLPGKFSTLVWSTTPQNAALLKSLSPEDFLAMLNAAFRLRPVDLAYMHTLPAGQVDEYEWRFKHAQTPAVPGTPQPAVTVHRGSVASFPLRLRHADAYISHRVALVGDAAHTVHPLAGQGLNSGQGDVASLSRCLEDAVAHGADIGVTMSLERYASERYAANHVLLGVCDKLHKLYSVESGPLVSLRSWGLQAVNALSPVKSFLMRQAAGGARGF